MKELSIEEKAKRYDEAIKKAKNTIEVNRNIPDIVECVESLFPELRESEDERIRKEIIAHIKWCEDSGYCAKEEMTRWITFLEKQAQKLVWSEKDKNMLKWVIGYLENKMLNTPILEERTACKNAIAWLEEKLKDEQKPDTQYSTEWSISDFRTWQYIVSDVLTKKDGIGQYLDSGECKKIAKYMQEEWGGKLGKEQTQKELCKGEDYGVDGLYHAISILEKTLGKVYGYQSNDGILEHECAISAVKKLYEQKPAAWSEEDTRLLDNCISLIEDIPCTEDEQNWLKGIKDRVQQQSQWKPSDEQMDALESAIVDSISSIQKHSLESLYNELKKL